MPHLQEAELSVRHDAQDHFVEFLPIGFNKGEPLRQTLSRGLDLVEQHGVTFWLGNLLQSRVMDPDDEQWTQQVWMPRAISLGIRKIALIQPADIFGKMQAIRWERDPLALWETLPYEMRMFGEVNDARAWFRGEEAHNSVLPGF